MPYFLDLLTWSLGWVRDFCPAREEKKKNPPTTKPLTEAAAKSHVFSEGSKGNPRVRVAGKERDKTGYMGFFNVFEEDTLLKVVPLEKKNNKNKYLFKVWEKKEEAQLIKCQLLKFQPVKNPI